MKKNLITINSILLLSLLVFSGCQKETSDTLASNQVTAASKLESSTVALSETQVLIRKWTEWIFTRDASLAPWDDATGDKQYAAQPYANGTMLLGGGSSPDLVKREITININQYQNVFLPLVDVSNIFNNCFYEHPSNGNVPNGIISGIITEALNGKRTLTLNWDGNSLLPGKLKDLRNNSGYWEFLPNSSWYGECTSPTTYYADGFWAKVPLTLGVHTLEVAGDLDLRRFKSPFSDHVIYTINVTN